MRTKLKQWLALLIAQFGGDAAKRRRLARKKASQILSELTILRFVSKSRKGKVQKVRFEYPLLLTRDELWCPLDLRSRPAGITTEMFRDEAVVKSLEDRLHSAVRIDTLANGKLCYVVRLAGTSFPEVFGINAFKLPPEAPPLAFPVGITGEGEHSWVDLANLPHLLLVGSTGKGKSNFVHAMLCTWISRNSPNDIEIWLADHKGGAELNRYKSLMPVKGAPGIVRRFSYKPEDTIALLEAAQKEMEKRLELLRQADASDVDDYARQTGQYMRRIAIVIDEIFFLMLNKQKIDSQPGSNKRGFTISAWAEHLFAKIASAGRAPGVHLVIATQKTGKDVLTPMITANFESRIVFAMSDMYQSIYAIGNSDAVGLPKGRVIFRGEAGEMTEIQSPRIAPDQTRLLVNRIARYGPDGGLGRKDEATRFLAEAKLLLLIASERLGGDFARAKLLAQDGVRGVITQERFGEIATRLERDGVLDPGGPRKARRVSRGYLNRPHLLDTLYGDPPDQPATVDAVYEPQTEPNRGQTVVLDQPYGLQKQKNGLRRSDAVNNKDSEEEDTVYGLDKNADHVPSHDGTTGVPDLFLRALGRRNEEEEEGSEEAREDTEEDNEDGWFEG
jgi:hypothetical protein